MSITYKDNGIIGTETNGRENLLENWKITSSKDFVNLHLAVIP